MSPLDPRAEALRERVRARFETDAVPLLTRLVEQPSCTRERDDVEACFALLDEAAGRSGLVVERHPDPAGLYAAHRVYRTSATAAGDRALALVGHLDTVFPRKLGFFGFRREGDVARGPGVLDMKSGLVSVLAALDALADVDPAARARLEARFVVVSDEEVGSPSSAALFARLAPLTTEALVFEAGRRQDLLVTRRKGSGLYTVVAHGKAAHAGNRHEDGVSAIWALSLLVPRIEGLTDYARGTTASIGLIEGGTAKNTVPDRAELHLDARYGSAAETARFEAALRAIVEHPFEGLSEALAPPKLWAATFTLEGRVSRPPMEPSEATALLLGRYGEAARAAGLGSGEAPLQGGGSDANLLAAAGVPTLDGLGPWGEHFHETREWCSLSSLERRIAALAIFLAIAAG
jgi:glutamate carboxypeptidase